MKHTPYRINKLIENQVFVFGSNEAGKHGAGAALTAKLDFGAIYGVGIGMQGQSYGIPTKDKDFNKLTLAQIKLYVDEFIQYAKKNSDKEFLVTAIGCGLAHNKPSQIAPMFNRHSDNVILPLDFYRILYPNEKLI